MIWPRLTLRQREALTFNVLGAVLPVASLLGDPPVPFVLPIVGIASSFYAMYLWHQINKER